MRIVLIRHGRPEAVPTARIDGDAIGEWLRAYDATGLDRALVPPSVLRAVAAGASCILSSATRRASESAAWIAGAAAVSLDPELREAPLPRALPVPLRLPSSAWIAIARLAWLAGFGECEETAGATSKRAQRVAGRLGELAAHHDLVVAVGHGMFNRFLAAELRRQGWDGPRFLPVGYWGSATFERGERRSQP